MTHEKLELKYQQLYKSMMDAFASVNMQGQLQEFNESFQQMLGYTSEELQKLSYVDLTPTKWHAMEAEIIEKQVFIRGHSDIYEKEYRRKDGTTFPVELRTNLLRDEAGRPVAMWAIIRDISKRKEMEQLIIEQRRVEEELREIKVMLQAAMDQGQVGIAIVDAPDGKIRYVNDASLLIHGITREELTRAMSVNEDVSLWKLLDLDGEVLPLEEVPLMRAILYGESNGRELIIRRSDREDRIVLSKATPIRDEQQKVIAAVVVLIDITETKKLAERLMNTQKLESLGVLAGGIAHDLNNLLSGIFGYIDLAQEKILTKECDEGLTFLKKSMETFARAKDLAKQLLTFSKGGEPLKKVCKVEMLLKQSMQFALSGSNISINFQIAEDLWGCKIDENQIGQVLSNITINAHQAMLHGGVLQVTAENVVITSADLRVGHLLQAGDYVKIMISDTGVGIAPENLSRIFDPYFTTKQYGKGLGLAICYSIIKKHDGVIEVQSEVGKGTSCTLFLPATDLIDLDFKDHSPANLEVKQKQQKKGHILIMDDEDYIRDFLREVLEFHGYTVSEAASGQEVLQFLREQDEKKAEPLDALILDLTIPGGMGGLETITEIRKQNNRIPAFVSSGFSKDPVIAQPLKFGFTDSLSKPYLIQEVIQLLETYLNV
ncbi:MAG: PAS domain S-box protein [Oligoflexia bacterium]|nr:PAS domain S-box protein [Oligoflexia bacterium]